MQTAACGLALRAAASRESELDVRLAELARAARGLDALVQTSLRSRARGRVWRHAERLHWLWASQLQPALARAGVELVPARDATPLERGLLARTFEREIFPVLTPLAFDAGHPFPFVSSLSLNLGFFVSGVRGSGRRFVRVKLPEPLRRFVPLGSGERLVLLEEVVAAEAERLFPGATVEETALFRVLRGSRGDESPVVRLEVADGASRELLAMLQTQLAAPDDAVCPVRGLLKLDDLAALAGELRRRSSRAA